jgi:hypothetical protein
MVVTSRRVKKQVKKNAMNVDSIQRNGRMVFNRRLGKAKTGGTGGGGPTRAACTEDAGNNNRIDATLFNSDGTTGTAIDVHCLISRGTALNTAFPFLEIGDEIFVTKSTDYNGGNPVSQWYCVTTFTANEECGCP